jgi:hypothetical protein
MPCPLCSVYGGRTWGATGDAPWVIGGAGVPFSVLRDAVQSDAAFEAAFGERLREPKTFRGGAFACCPICDDGTFTATEYGRVVAAEVRRACELVVAAAVSADAVRAARGRRAR